MPRYAFRIVNVFTVDGDRFSGNPLCVFEDARGLTTEQMQSLARQMNLSETTFVLPSEQATAHVRIFTPGYEMPFAGHPTLGTASVVAGDVITFEMKAGLVAVARDANGYTLKVAYAPKTRPVEAPPADLARMLSLPEDAVGEPLWVDTGVEQLVIPIRSSELVRRAKADPVLIEKYGFSAARQEAMAYLWASDTPEHTVRFFFTSNGAVIEDAATGSACANLGGYLLAKGKSPITVSLRQGDAVQRPSRLGLRVDETGIYVSGQTMELGSGTIELW
ncbi:MAG: PhzF family phenazine biosynthesis protein [Myxococcota bacterium]|nr:PhzF family phenazine biosynthesis protein [Myxococcota bacterium]